MTLFQNLQVGLSGAELAYIDSGAVGLPPSYTTIVAIHGICCAASTFKRAQIAASSKGVRFIAVNRRNYPNSTPFSPEELQVVYTGSPTQKAEWLKDRGHEIARLIDALIQKYDLPPISGTDGKLGGVILLGWSLGVGDVNATLANVDTLPDDVRLRVAAYLRGVIVHEPPPVILGLPMPEKDWAPFLVDSIPPELRLPFFCQWLTAYFDHHADLSKRDLNGLEYVLPSSITPGSIYKMSKDEQEAAIITTEQVGSVEGPYMMGFRDQLNAVYHKALFDPAVREVLPNLMVSCLMGDRSPAFGIAGVWAIEDEAKKQGISSIRTVLATGANHYVHWDDSTSQKEHWTFIWNAHQEYEILMMS